MHITKTLFTEFTTTPKLAWFHVHDKEVYNQILEAEYGGMDWAEIGQSIEDQVKELLWTHTIVTPEWDYDACISETQQLLASQPAVIYQPRFQSENLMIRCDFLVRNTQWTYDLREVKAKNTVRKTTKWEPLKEELVSDISFQKYVLEQTLWTLFSGKCNLVYLNKDYVRQGDLDIAQLIKVEEVTQEIMTSVQVSQIITTMQAQLPLDRQAFETLYPYNNDDYLTYFWEPAPKGSIRYIPWIGNKKKPLYESWMTDILTLWNTEKKLLLSSKWEVSKASQYVNLYQQGETVINIDWVKNKLSQLTYPLFFYDYETVTSPVPLFDGTSPRQHIVVQYSVHKIDADGMITHKEALIDGSIANNKPIIDQLHTDLEWWQHWTFIVWFKWFENKRNEETALMYPEYKTFFESVNVKTFDLMEVFSEFHYFDRRFKGSASIKKVLPVLTDISYNGLEVPNWAVATGLLLNIATGKLTGEPLTTQRKNLLTYCEQDTWAMVRIWQELLHSIQQ